MRILTVFLVSTIMIPGCSVSSLIQTRWEYPAGARVRVLCVPTKEVSEHTIPFDMQLRTDLLEAYYVEILTSDSRRMYGTLEALATTKLTELTFVRVEITPEIVERVLHDQVSQITVSDPAENTLVLRLNIGNRMPPRMSKAYEDMKLKAY
jgi:hypothetical protein